MYYQEWKCGGISFMVLQPEVKQKPKKESIFDKFIRSCFTFKAQ